MAGLKPSKKNIKPSKGQSWRLLQIMNEPREGKNRKVYGNKRKKQFEKYESGNLRSSLITIIEQLKGRTKRHRCT